LVILLGGTAFVILLVWDVWTDLSFSVQPAVSAAALAIAVEIRKFIVKVAFMVRKKGCRSLRSPIRFSPGFFGSNTAPNYLQRTQFFQHYDD